MPKLSRLDCFNCRRTGICFGVGLSVSQDGGSPAPPVRPDVYPGTKAKPLASLADGFAVNSDMVDCRERADECRRLAKLRAGSEHWAVFLEMAETWEQLGKLRELSRRPKGAGIFKTKIPAAVLRIEDAVRDLEELTQVFD